MARSAADAAILLGAIAGHDSKDPTTLLDPVTDYLTREDVRGLRIGVDARWNYDDVDEPVERALRQVTQVFAELGATLIDVTVPSVEQSVIDWSPLCAVEAAVAHENTYPSRKAEYGPVLATVLETGREIPATEFHKILCRRIELRGRFAELLAQVDVLLAPAQPFAPLTLDTIRSLGEQPGLILKLQRFTAPFDMTGQPTIALPAGFSEKHLPIGFQLIAGHLCESRLVQAARAFQNATSWHRNHPHLQDDILPGQPD